MDKPQETQMPKEHETPKTQTLRITEKQYAMMLEATKRFQEAQATMQNIVAAVFAAHDMDPTEIVKDGKDENGRFLVVRVSE